MKNKKAILGVLFLLFLSFFLVFYKSAQIPKYLAFDEIEFTKLALSLDNKPYTPYSLLATGHSTLYFYILLLSLKTFGTTVFALRLPAAIFGVLSVIVFYLILKKVFQENKNITVKRYLPFIITFVFLTCRWFINFSRFSFEPAFLLFLELTSIYFLLKSFRTFKWNSLVLSGTFAGLAFNSYTPGRIFVLLPLFFLLVHSSWSTTRNRASNLKKLLYFIIPFLLIITPLIYQLSIIKDPRIDQLFFWRNHEMTIQEKVNGTWQNITSLTSMFFFKGDMNGRHNYPGKPALNPIMAGLFILGLILSLKKWQDKDNQLFLIYFLISMFPSLAIYPWENPSMLRTFTVIPSVVYFIGIGLTNILTFIKNSKHFNNLGLIVISLLVFFSSIYELRTYFKYQAKVFESSFEIKHPLEKAIKMKNVYEKN